MAATPGERRAFQGAGLRRTRRRLPKGTRSQNASSTSGRYKATATTVTDFAVIDATLTDPPGCPGDHTVPGIVPTATGVAVRLDTSSALQVVCISHDGGVTSAPSMPPSPATSPT